MNQFQRSLDNYLTAEQEIYSLCEDGHDWKYEADCAGMFRACIVCEHEEDIQDLTR